MITAKSITQLILDGDVEEAIAMSGPRIEALSSLQRSDIAYIEPRMQSEVGHFCQLATIYEGLMSTENLKMAVLHRFGWDSGERQGWYGVFPIADHLGGVEKISNHKQLAGFIQYYECFFVKCLNETQASLAIFPTARFLTILAAIKSVEKVPTVRGAILGFMEANNARGCDNSLIDSTFKSASELILRSKKAFLVFAESEAIRDYLLRSGFPADKVFVNPYPAANRFGDSETLTGPSKRPHFGCLGGTRDVHNPGLLATYLMRSNHHLLDWTVRLNLELAAEKLNLDVMELRKALRNENVNLLEQRLENAEYDQLVQSFDVMLLPYGDRYRTIGSGIFLESICSGVVPLVPANSTMYDLYLQLGGKAPPIEDLSIEGIGKSVDYCVRKLGELKANAYQVRRTWLSHTQGPHNWSHHVLTFVQKYF